MQGLGNPLQYGKAFGESYGCGAKCRAKVTCVQGDDVRQLGQVHHVHGVTLTLVTTPITVEATIGVWSKPRSEEACYARNREAVRHPGERTSCGGTTSRLQRARQLT